MTARWTMLKDEMLISLHNQGVNLSDTTDKINTDFKCNHSLTSISQRKCKLKLFRNPNKRTFKQLIEDTPYYDEFIKKIHEGLTQVQLIKWLKQRDFIASQGSIRHFTRIILGVDKDKPVESSKPFVDAVSVKYNIIHSYFKNRRVVQIRNLTEPFRSQAIDAPVDLNKAVRDMEGLGMLKRLNDKQVSFQ